MSDAKRRPPHDTIRPELHDLDKSAFLEEVHSFEFWFQAVEGYLAETTYGHDPEMAEDPLSDEDRERLIGVLCNYCAGESAALETAAGLVSLAPNRMTKVFLSTQVADEGRHLEVFLHRLGELGVENPESEVAKRASPSMLAFKDKLAELVAGRDWASALFAQNVALESLEFVVFGRHAKTADRVTAQILERVVKDERRHMGFGENELGRYLRDTPDSRSRIHDLRVELDHLVDATLADTVRHLGLPADDQKELGRMYRESIERLGLLG